MSGFRLHRVDGRQYVNGKPLEELTEEERTEFGRALAVALGPVVAKYEEAVGGLEPMLRAVTWPTAALPPLPAHWGRSATRPAVQARVSYPTRAAVEVHYAVAAAIRSDPHHRDPTEEAIAAKLGKVDPDDRLTRSFQRIIAAEGKRLGASQHFYWVAICLHVRREYALPLPD